MLEFKLSIFYGSYLVFPLLIYIFYEIRSRKNFSNKSKVGFILMSILVSIFIDSRFIEPNIVVLNHTNVRIGLDKKVKIALISDIHLGTYTDKSLLETTVKKINSISNLDYVFIAGDLTYFENEQKNFKLEELFLSIKNIEVPVYWVLGNHDVELPGPSIRKNLVKVLNGYGMNFLNNQSVELNGFTLVGLGSHWNGEDDVSIVDRFQEEDKVIALMHNPDTIFKYKNKKIDLSLAGHTHGGQIKIPYIYKLVLHTAGKFDEGLTQEKNTQLFVTSGIGVVGLPFRFLNPPVIDVLEIE